MMKNNLYYTLPVLALLAACTHDVPMVNLGIDDTYYVERMSKLPLQPAFTGAEYRWTLLRDNGADSILATTRDYIFLARNEGVYRIAFDVIDSSTPYHHEFTVNVVHEEVEYSPYIAKVLEYCPAPGQFINTMPQYEEGDSYADMLKKCEESISGKNDVLVSLGGYGGYITFSFDHTVINVEGEKDFMILGNTFYELTNPSRKGGSAEPGIVMVSYDTNCNGIADDEWYELAGSEYYKPTTKHNYSIRYERPDDNKIPVPDKKGFLSDTEYIKWTDSDGIVGYIAKNIYHTQAYYPMWIDDDVIEFSGSRLPDNGVDQSGIGSYYILYSFDWGYADNHPNEFDDLNSFDIAWAVDHSGNPVHLPGVDFIRVYTGVNQYCGWIGETSTEICRGQDLHISVNSDIPDDPIKDKNRSVTLPTNF